MLASQARDQFISHVAHELKSPLNIIHLYAESLAESDISEEQRINAINVINDEVERLSNLIANLLNISKIEAGSINLQQQRVKLHEFLTDTFEAVARSGANQQIDFHLNLPRTLPDIVVDKDLLRIALNNILTNAVKYNKPGGMVTMHVEESDDRIIVKISDTGLGIAAKDQNKIFDKFYRADDDNVTQRGGHGLGLALAREIIQLHHGSIELESEVGQGSEFTILLKKTTTFLN